MDIKVLSISLILFFLSGGNSACVDNKDLFNVTALVSGYRNGQKYNVTANFYLLKNFTVIDVTKASVPYLCEGMIIDFPKLEFFTLIHVNLSKVHTNAFQNVSNLRELSLALNEIKVIPAGAFNNLPSLKTLYLSVNQISFIEDGAFENLPNLKAVHLDRNRLTKINGNLFKNCPGINYINYNFNAIKRVPSTALQGIRPTRKGPISILLNNNLITEVDALELDTSSPLNLYLKGNEITKFSGVFFNLNEGSRLYLNKNKISCVSDDVLETMKNTTKYLYLSDNPITCDCLDRMDNMLKRVEGQGQLDYTITDRFKCLSLT